MAVFSMVPRITLPFPVSHLGVMFWLQKLGIPGLRWFCVGCAKDRSLLKM